MNPMQSPNTGVGGELHGNHPRNDYSHFPFDELTIDQIAQLMIGEIELNGDRDFIAACREQLKKRKQ